MEKVASSRALHHCLSLAELVGFLVLDSILVWITRLQKVSFGLFTSSPRAYTIEETKNITSEAKLEEDVELVMEKLGMPFVARTDKLMGSDEVGDIFVESEPSMEEVEAAFCMFDDNDDGYIDATELQRVLCKLGFREGADLGDCKQMIETFDENKDGKIDFDEFVRFMERCFS